MTTVVWLTVLCLLVHHSADGKTAKAPTGKTSAPIKAKDCKHNMEIGGKESLIFWEFLPDKIEHPTRMRFFFKIKDAATERWFGIGFRNVKQQEKEEWNIIQTDAELHALVAHATSKANQDSIEPEVTKPQIRAQSYYKKDRWLVINWILTATPDNIFTYQDADHYLVQNVTLMIVKTPGVVDKNGKLKPISKAKDVLMVDETIAYLCIARSFDEPVATDKPPKM